MPSPLNEPKEYSVSINTDDVRKAIRLTGSALYAFIEEALTVVGDDEFEMFAQDVLGVLTRHADQLADSESAWKPNEDDEFSCD